MDLRDADQQAQQPGEEDRDPVRSPVQRPQRLTDGQAPVQGHQQEHVGGSKHPHHLQVLDQPAEEIRPVKPEGDVPDELGQHLEDGHDQVSDAQVLHEEIHAGVLLPGGVDGKQHAQVAGQGEEEDEAEDRHLHLGHLLVPLQGVRGAVPPGGLVLQADAAVPQRAVERPCAAPRKVQLLHGRLRPA